MDALAKALTGARRARLCNVFAEQREGLRDLFEGCLELQAETRAFRSCLSQRKRSSHGLGESMGDRKAQTGTFNVGVFRTESLEWSEELLDTTQVDSSPRVRDGEDQMIAILILDIDRNAAILSVKFHGIGQKVQDDLNRLLAIRPNQTRSGTAGPEDLDLMFGGNGRHEIDCLAENAVQVERLDRQL